MLENSAMTIDDKGEIVSSRASLAFQTMHDLLTRAQNASEPGTIQVALIEAVSGLLAHVEKQQKMIDALESDMRHRQSPVTHIAPQR